MNKFEVEQKVEESLKVDVLRKAGFKLIGSGADKVVFETLGSVRKVVKIDKECFLEKIIKLLEKNKKDCSLLMQKINNYLKIENREVADNIEDHKKQRLEIEKNKLEEKKIK